MRLLYRCIFLVLAIYLGAVLCLLTLRQNLTTDDSMTQIHRDSDSDLRESSVETSSVDLLNSLAIVGATNGQRLPVDNRHIRFDRSPIEDKKLILLWAGPDDIDDRNLGGCPDHG